MFKLLFDYPFFSPDLDGAIEKQLKQNNSTAKKPKDASYDTNTRSRGEMGEGRRGEKRIWTEEETDGTIEKQLKQASAFLAPSPCPKSRARVIDQPPEPRYETTPEVVEEVKLYGLDSTLNLCTAAYSVEYG